MDILKLIEIHLDNHDHDNIIYFLDETEKDKYEKIIELLNKDYGYLDVVLDFNDYDKLNPLLSKLSDKNVFNRIMILSDYLNYSILTKANIDIVDGMKVSNVGKHLFSDDLEKYNKMNEVIFTSDVVDALKAKAEKKNKKARIHYLLDNVDNIILQKCINDLYVYHADVAMMGYTTKNLSTTLTSNSNYMENIHDYMSFDSDVKQKKLIKGGK